MVSSWFPLGCFSLVIVSNEGPSLTEHKSVSSPKGQPPSFKVQNTIQQNTILVATTKHKCYTEDLLLDHTLAAKK